MYKRILEYERSKKQKKNNAKTKKNIMASKAITHNVKKERKYMWELNSGRRHSRWVGSQLNYYRWHDGMCYNMAYKLIIKKLENKIVY
jgi:hypothetical protein